MNQMTIDHRADVPGLIDFQPTFLPGRLFC